MYGIDIDPVDTLARTIWGEARNQGYDGMYAIACVVMNRVNNPTWWGDTIVNVCTKPFQFSCWLPNDPNRPKLIAVTNSDPQFATALGIAATAANGTLVDITNGSTHYFNLLMPHAPEWASGRTPTKIIGTHAFFNLVA
jgi:spore germination cell wall hydrolase CwlJ-like protein